MAIHILAQAIKLPGIGGGQTSVDYPAGFVFTGGIGDVLSRAIPLVLAFAGIGLLLMLLSAGFTFLTSAGDAKKMEQGKQQLTFAIVGFIIVFAAYWVVQLVGIMFGSGVTTGFK